MIMERIPKWPLVGAHLALNRKSGRPDFRITGNPSRKINTVIRRRSPIAEKARIMRIFSIIFSFIINECR
jgi:hypothetical protein